jgi:hypothetical protein
MLNPAITTDPKAPPLREGDVPGIDWDTALPLEMVRLHTKTDDVPSVTDNQLRLYRKAAVEAAELYTGTLLAKQRVVTEPLTMPHRYRQNVFRSNKNSYKVTLQYPVSDGVVYIYGGWGPDENRKFLVPKNTRTINVPIRNGYIDLSNCCDPCAKGNFNQDLMAMYKAGYDCLESVPAGILLGILQFIAWVIEHPGDEFLTMRNHLDSAKSVAGVYGSNNIAMISGALETWRQYDPEAI